MVQIAIIFYKRIGMMMQRNDRAMNHFFSAKQLVVTRNQELIDLTGIEFNITLSISTPCYQKK